MFYRQYIGESVGESVTEAEARDKLSRYYVDVNVVIETMRAGDTMYTPWAKFWYEDESIVK